MDWVIILGVACLGGLIGLLVGFYVNDAEQMDYQVLQGAVWVLAGAGVIAVFSLVGGPGAVTREYWFYPIGLLVGFILAPFSNSMSNWLERKAKR